jgi:hypothetical protein
MPRSQRMGSLSCFPGDGAREASSPLKTDSGPIQAGLGKEPGVMDVLQESRITGREIEGYRQMTKEVHMNKQRMQRNVSRGNRYSAKNAQKLPHAFSKITNSFLPQAEPLPSLADAPNRFGKINITKNEEIDRKLLRKDGDRRRGDRRMPFNGTGTGSLQIDTDLANTLRQTSNSLTVPKSRMSFELKLDEEWEVNVKVVKGYCSPSSYLLMILTFPARYIFIRKFLTG